jgi:hypothetical protein
MGGQGDRLVTISTVGIRAHIAKRARVIIVVVVTVKALVVDIHIDT